MIRATKLLEPGTRPEKVADTVVLDYDARYRRRVVLTGTGGLAFLLDLAEATQLKDGDALLLEDGRAILVRSADEDLAEITANDAAHLVRITWHLGNRHLPTQLLGDRLRIRRDHVIEAMVEGLGAKVRPVSAAFDPEGGAYGKGRVHNHHHDHDHGHDHGHHHHHGHHHGHDHG